MTSNATVELINATILEYRENGGSTKEISDGHHTFADLYGMRVEIFAALCRAYPEQSFVSYRHHDEDNDPIGRFGNGEDFIAGINTPRGTVAMHFKKTKLGAFAGINKVESAPPYDGYDQEEARLRIASLP